MARKGRGVAGIPCRWPKDQNTVRMVLPATMDLGYISAPGAKKRTRRSREWASRFQIRSPNERAAKLVPLPATTRSPKKRECMSDQPPSNNPRISLTAIQEMDRLARRFRCRLRDVAVNLSQDAGRAVPIGRDTVVEAARSVCRELLSETGPDSNNARGLDGQRPRAA